MNFSIFIRTWFKKSTRNLSVFIVVSYAVGIAVLSAAFALYDSSVIVGSPFGDEDRIVSIGLFDHQSGDWEGIPLDEVNTVIKSTPGLQYASPVALQNADIVVDSGSRTVNVAFVRSDFFSIFNTDPHLGRSFPKETDTLGITDVALISEELYKQEFDSSPEVIGSLYRIAGRNRQIMGVMPEGFDFPWEADLWVPLNTDTIFDETGHIESVELCALLADGASVNSTIAQLEPLVPRLRDANGERMKSSMGPEVFYWKEYYIGDQTQSVLFVLYVFAFFLFLVGVGNATLLTSIGVSARMVEFATRLSLGGTRSQIRRQIFTECVFLNLCGTLLGIVIYFGMAHLFSPFVTDSFSKQWMGFSLGLNTFAHFIVIFIISTSFSGVVAEYQLRGSTLFNVLKKNERTASRSNGGWFACIGIAIQALVAIISISGAFLVGEGINRSIDEGTLFKNDRIATTILSINPNEYPTAKEKDQYLKAIESAINEVSSVSEYCASIEYYGLQPLPRYTYQIQGHECYSDASCPQSFVNVVRGDYFGMAGIAVLAGRVFNQFDLSEVSGVAVVNETFAKLNFGSVGDAVGKRMTLWAGQRVEVVGVVEDVNMRGAGKLRSEAANAGIYLSQAQAGWGHIRYFFSYENSLAELGKELNTALLSRNNDKRIYDLVTYRVFQAGPLGTAKLLLSILTFSAVVIALFLFVSAFAFSYYQCVLKQKETGVRLLYGCGMWRLSITYGAKLIYSALLATILGAIGLHVGIARFSSLLAESAEPLKPLLIGFVFVGIVLFISIVVPVGSFIKKSIRELIDQ
ncbi:ABC transporter permease [Pelagicoccus sp. SDUM812002]|uniref:ABC transporter permease n=1 Tax=Pelagicoccus sp. SDUM812002 TaxID=3041266 RepID=UPI00280E1267|nr:ABC transporter permease [Pelagicoccus sp. SDUM812002]MDQ8188501.1 ABC transporter permease [Pelagicoccus sp. SDUM812002]